VIYSPAEVGIRTGLFVSTMGKETMCNGMGAAPASSAMVTDQAYIVRVVLPTPTIIRRFFWANGATASTDNVQVGIYNNDLTSFLRGTATLSATASVLQFDNVTDTYISAGRYWLAIVLTGTTATLQRHSNVATHGSGLYLMAAARPLPATLVPAASSGTGVLPLFGFTSIA
jgi:hypothetical protein